MSVPLIEIENSSSRDATKLTISKESNIPAPIKSEEEEKSNSGLISVNKSNILFFKLIYFFKIIKYIRAKEENGLILN